MKNLFSCLFLVFIFSLGLQAQLNEYKYIIIPKNFKGFKDENQYKTSTLLKYLFTKKGFETYYEDDLPSDLNTNRCLGLLAQLDHTTSMFVTKASIVLEDCNSNEVYKSLEGRSKEKDYTSSYKEAIEMAFTSINSLNYKYNPVETKSVSTTAVVIDAEGKGEPSENKGRQTTTAVEENLTQSEITPNPKTAAIENTAVVAASTSTIPKTSDSYVLYAQEIPNGYQLVDSTPKIRLKIYQTSIPEVYIGVNEKGSGLVYKRSNQWYFEYYVSGQAQLEEFTIKF
ncbi:hypothetical protein [uncultured Eudoraea sp.]|uniref:hypothetical protein n=1 Tax=uncultured Eudoraea sp. TaxID=1035614 RepID=UPI00260C8B1A|nr:hypothetical protein [uncultured Eudoraea sp.]